MLYEKNPEKLHLSKYAFSFEHAGCILCLASIKRIQQEYVYAALSIVSEVRKTPVYQKFTPISQKELHGTPSLRNYRHILFDSEGSRQRLIVMSFTDPCTPPDKLRGVGGWWWQNLIIARIYNELCFIMYAK